MIEPCLDTELSEFPLRMRDWLKNVLVTLYERDEDNNLLSNPEFKTVIENMFREYMSIVESGCPTVPGR